MAMLLLALLTLTGCTVLPAERARSGPQEELTPTPIPTPVTVSKPTYGAARGEVTKQLILGGRVAPVAQTNLFFKTSGRVRTVFVKTGDNVKVGQLLADLEMENVERDLTGSKLDLERAQARLDAAKAELQENIKQAQANLDIARENRAIIMAQDPTPRKVKAEVALQTADLARKQAEGAALQQATLNYTEAQAAYDLVLQDIAVHSHQVTIAGLQVNLAQVALDSLNRGVDPLLANDVKRAQFAVDKLLSAVADAQIVAPFDGQVQLAFILTEGAAIDAFQYVVTLSDLTELEVRVDTINIQPGQLSEGMPATISLVGRPGVELKGHIRRLPALGVLAGADQDKSLHIALDSSGTLVGYQSGDLTRVALVLEQKQDVLWLPPAAIRTFEGRRFVVVQESGGQRRVDIKVGLEGDDRVEIVGGLTEGQIVVGQ
jgi:multidrug efflux pump subunit AcrA (membrane-fusion protein)